MRIAIRNRILKLTNLAAQNVAWARVAQETVKPYVTLNVISAPRSATHSGNDGMVAARVQVSIFSDTYGNTVALKDQIRALCNYANTISTPFLGFKSLPFNFGGFAGGTDAVIAKIMLANEIEGYESDTKTFTNFLDFMILYYE